MSYSWDSMLSGGGSRGSRPGLKLCQTWWLWTSPGFATTASRRGPVLWGWWQFRRAAMWGAPCLVSGGSDCSCVFSAMAVWPVGLSHSAWELNSTLKIVRKYYFPTHVSARISGISESITGSPRPVHQLVFCGMYGVSHWRGALSYPPVSATFLPDTLAPCPDVHSGSQFRERPATPPGSCLPALLKLQGHCRQMPCPAGLPRKCFYFALTLPWQLL